MEKFASPLTWYQLQNMGIQGLPPESFWCQECEEDLALSLISFFKQNLDNTDLWLKFNHILNRIYDDDGFFCVFKKTLGLYIGSISLASSILDRARSKELIWETACISLIRRFAHLNDAQDDFERLYNNSKL